MNAQKSNLSRGARFAALLILMGGVALAATPEISVTASLNTPVMLAGKQESAYLKVGLRGFEMRSGQRAAVNLALVIDRSGSMSGEKIERAKEAAIMAVDRLAPDDLVSVVLYNTTVEVLVPATKASDRSIIRQKIRQISAGGNTALFAGVSKGAAEVRKFAELDRVNRIILLSDGLANHGPSSPAELGQLGASLHDEGITVTTIGLGMGYNEDLMYELARNGHGNHIFAEEAGDLAKAFDQEIGDVLATVARNARVRIECEPGIRPVRLVGREGIIDGKAVEVSLGNLYSEQEKYLILEVEVPSWEEVERRQVAAVDVSCENLSTRKPEHHRREVAVQLTRAPEEVEREMDRETQVDVVQQIGAETNRAAMELRDQGQIEEAKEVLMGNGSALISWGDRLDSDKLMRDAASNTLDYDNMDPGKYERQRKVMLEKQRTWKGQEGKQGGGILVPEKPATR